MNNLLRVMALSEDELHSVVFVQGRDEGGINVVFDPMAGKDLFQVFIHKKFPLVDVSSWEFDTFGAARSYASKVFSDWEMAQWDFKVRRKCADGGGSCGDGTCAPGGSCGTSGGGCGTTDGSSGGGCSSCSIDEPN